MARVTRDFQQGCTHRFGLNHTTHAHTDRQTIPNQIAHAEINLWLKFPFSRASLITPFYVSAFINGQLVYLKKIRPLSPHKIINR